MSNIAGISYSINFLEDLEESAKFQYTVETDFPRNFSETHLQDCVKLFSYECHSV